MAVEFLERIELDDSLSVWGVHGIGGTWGALATGLFVGIGFQGMEAFTEASIAWQVLVQVMSIATTWGWAFVTTAAILWVLKVTVGLRVSDTDEAVGLDAAEHGETTYRL